MLAVWGVDEGFVRDLPRLASQADAPGYSRLWATTVRQVLFLIVFVVAVQWPNPFEYKNSRA